jgi:hypothetical protein
MGSIAPGTYRDPNHSLRTAGPPRPPVVSSTVTREHADAIGHAAAAVARAATNEEHAFAALERAATMPNRRWEDTCRSRHDASVSFLSAARTAYLTLCTPPTIHGDDRP